MNNIILVLCAALAVANAWTEDVELKEMKKHLETLNKIDKIKYIFEKLKPIYKIDGEITEDFNSAENHTRFLNERKRNLTKYLRDQLNIFEVPNTECDKYRSKMPNINETDSAMTNCIQQYWNAMPRQQVNYISKMYFPYSYVAFSRLTACMKIIKTPDEFVLCFYSHAKPFHALQKVFQKKYTTIKKNALNEYDAAGNNKKALECTKRVEDDVHSTVKTLVQNCMKGVDN